MGLMKKASMLLIFCLSSLGAQPDERSDVKNLCEHPVLEKAREQGLNSLTLEEIPQFWFRALLCKRYVRKGGEDIDFKDLYKQKQEENFENARELSGIGTCFAAVTGLVLLYSFLGFVAGTV